MLVDVPPIVIALDLRFLIMQFTIRPTTTTNAIHPATIPNISQPESLKYKETPEGAFELTAKSTYFPLKSNVT